MYAIGMLLQQDQKVLSNDLYIWSLVFLGADSVSGWDNSRSPLMSMEKGRTPVHSCLCSLSGPDLGAANWQWESLLWSRPLNQHHRNQNGIFYNYYYYYSLFKIGSQLFKNLYSLPSKIYFSECIWTYIGCLEKKKTQHLFSFAALILIPEILGLTN